MSPVRLHEDGIHLGEIDGFGLGSDSFDEGAEAEVFLTARRVPSELRTMRLRASSVKVV